MSARNMSAKGWVEEGNQVVERFQLDEKMRYIAEMFCGDDALDAIYCSAGDRKAIQVSPMEGKILYLLLRSIGAHSVVEVGSLVGYSSAWMAKALPEGGRLYSIDISPENCAMAQENHKKAGLANKILQINGDAKEELYRLTGPFDAIFIDGDKHGYCNYLDWADSNIRSGGLILADNVFLFGSIASDIAPRGVSKRSWKAMREFNERMADSSKYDAMILPIFDGLMVGYKKS